MYRFSNQKFLCVGFHLVGIPRLRYALGLGLLLFCMSRVFATEKPDNCTSPTYTTVFEEVYPSSRGATQRPRLLSESSMGYWNPVKHWPPLLTTMVYNSSVGEQVWCQHKRCM